jgi:sugar phosphate isomerase/epimerase
MRLGYNTNGLAHHDCFQAVELLADLGYESVAITLDQHALNPYRDDFCEQLERMRELLKRRGLRSVIETGARFLLDPRVKHEPTLVTADAGGRARRVDFYRRAIDAAKTLESDCVSLWSGILRGGADDAEAFSRLTGGLREVLEYAAERQVAIGFEPEPGMFIDTMARFDALLEKIDAPYLQLTLDIGHLHCLGETPIADYIERYGHRLANVHIEDMRRGVHQHLMFGEGEIDFPPVLDALRRVGYAGGVHVELSRHSHDGPQAARRAHEFLAPLMSK